MNRGNDRLPSDGRPVVDSSISVLLWRSKIVLVNTGAIPIGSEAFECVVPAVLAVSAQSVSTALESPTLGELAVESVDGSFTLSRFPRLKDELIDVDRSLEVLFDSFVLSASKLPPVALYVKECQIWSLPSPSMVQFEEN